MAPDRRQVALASRARSVGARLALGRRSVGTRAVSSARPSAGATEAAQAAPGPVSPQPGAASAVGSSPLTAIATSGGYRLGLQPCGATSKPPHPLHHAPAFFIYVAGVNLRLGISFLCSLAKPLYGPVIALKNASALPVHGAAVALRLSIPLIDRAAKQLNNFY